MLACLRRYVTNAFKSYAGGVFTDTSVLSSYGTNHAVLLVGFNQTGSYLKIKNSWGGSWGESVSDGVGVGQGK